MGKPKAKEKFADEQGRGFVINPKNEAQRHFLADIGANVITVGAGSAGTGKTYIAAAYAATELSSNPEVHKVILTRPNVGMGNDIGALPGDEVEKTSPWVKPLLRVFQQVMGKGAVESQLNHENIEIQPLFLIRGMSYDNSIIICDEAQNCTLDDLKALSTRVGMNSKLILIGDPVQNDLKGYSGLEDFCEICLRYGVKGFSSVRFYSSDIVRSGIVKALVMAFEREGV